MADLDNLQVNITGSSAQAVSAIDKLIGALSKLNSALNNYKAGSEYAQGMNNLASGLERVARAVNGIDANNIKNMSRAIASLANVGSKIKIGTTISKDTSYAEKRIDALAQKIASDFGVKGKSSIEIVRKEIANLVREMDAATSKSMREDAWQRGIQSLGNELAHLGKTDSFRGMSREIDIVRSKMSELKWDTHDSVEFGDDLIRVFGKLGARNLGQGSVSASKWAEELNDKYGFKFDTFDNVSAISSVVDWLERAEEDQIGWNEALRQGGDYQEIFNQKILEAQHILKGETGSKKWNKLSDNELGISPEVQQVNPATLESIATGLTAIKQVGEMPDFSGLNGLAKNLTKLAEVDTNKVAETLPPIAESLRAFEGVTLPDLPNFESFGKGLKSLKGMGTDTASTAASVLPQIAQALRGFEGVTLPDFSNLEGFAKGLTALRGMGSDNAVKASYVLPQIAEGLKQFSGVTIPDFGNLDGVTKFAKSLGVLASSDLESAIKNIPRLAPAFNELASSINQGNIDQETTRFATAMSQLARALGGKEIETSLSNMPRLAQAFNELIASVNQGNLEEKTATFAQAMAQLSRSCEQAAPRMRSVQKQTLNWSNLFEAMGARIRAFNHGALNLLWRGMQNVGRIFADAASRAKVFVSSLFGMKQQTEDTASTLNRLARSIGKFWASAFWVINGVRSLGKSIKSSMDYIETLNYFKAAFRQVSETAVGNWSKLGYESAEAYADSFEKRAKQLTTKMTGFELSDTGVLSMTGGKTLGLNPNTLLNYQAQFAQMASSMGASANNATLLSQALVEIGADLASVKNLNFEDVWKDMASGMVGMSRTLDKYGVNIRAAALNQKLLDLGIQATVKDLSGADKAMLRTIVLLDSTKYAWGDLANTINQPANQLRLLTANLQNCARMLGNIFLPLVAKVLPYLNAMAIAVQRLLTYIAQLLGIDLSKITSSVGGAGDAMSDILDDADGLEDGLDDAAESAKKLKNNLLGVDELNVISENVTSEDANGNMSSLLDDAFLDSLSEYQKAWDEAFANMENRANELADKIAKWFKNLFKPISEAWAKVGDKVKDAWEKAFTSLANLLKSVFKDVWDVWQSPVTTDIFENLFNILKDIGLIISHIADNFRKAWEEGGRGKAILEAIWDIVYAISLNAREVADAFVGWAKDLNFAPILESIKNLLRAIADNAYDIVGIFADWYTIVWTGIGKYLIEEFFPKVLDSITKMVNMVDWASLRANIDRIYTSLVELAKVVGGWLLDAWDRLATTLGNFLNSDFFGRLADSFDRLVQDLKKAENINDVINAIFGFADDRVIDVGTLVKTISNKLNEVLDKIDFRNIGQKLATLINDLLKSADINSLSTTIAGIINALFDTIIGLLDTLDWNKIGTLIGQILEKIDWSKVFTIIGKALSGLGGIIAGMFKEAPLETTVIGGIIATLLTNSIMKALTGKGIAATILESILGISGETSAFGELTDAAGGASKAKIGFTRANRGLFTSTKKGVKGLTSEAGAIDDVAAAGASGIGGVLKTLGGIALTIGGTITAVANFFKMWQGGFDWLHEALMVLGVALAAVGAIILGAPALVAGVVAAIVAAIGTAAVLIHEHWDEIKEWFSGVGDWLKEKVGEPIKKFFTETLPEGFDNFKTKVSEWKANTEQAFGEWKDNTKQQFAEWKDSFIEWKDNTISGFSEWKDKVVSSISEWKDSAVTAFSEWKNKAVSAFTEWKNSAINDVATWYKNTKAKIEDWSGKVAKTLVAWAQDAKKTFEDFREKVYNTVVGWKQDIENRFNEWRNTVHTTIVEWKADVENRFNEWRTAVHDTIKGWKQDVENRFNEWRKTVHDTVVGWKNDVENRFNEWRTAVHDTIVAWKNDVETRFNEWRTAVHDTIVGWKADVENRFDEWRTNVIGMINDWSERTWSAISSWASDTWDKISGWIDDTRNKFDGWISDVKSWFEDFKNDVGGKIWQWSQNALGDIWNFASNAGSWLSGLVGNAKEWFSERNWTFQGAADGITETFRRIGNAAEDGMRRLKRITNDFSGWDFDWINGRQQNSGSIPKVPKYAVGGFPEDGLFFANHNELVGTFSNGRTAVANNEQITDGIARAVYQAFTAAGANGGREAELLEELIRAVERGQIITIDGREIVNAYDQRSARNGYSFA